MAIHIEGQYEDEVIQIKSRELQMDNTEKLNEIIPVVETINDVNLSRMELDTSEIKDIVSQNLEEQANLDDISESIDKLNKNLSTLKGQITKLSNKIDRVLEDNNG